MANKVNPIILHDNETKEDYTLEFTRESIKFAESKGFDVSNIEKKPMTTIPELFYYSFRANHKQMPKDKIDKLFEDIKPLPQGFVERLGDLYALPFDAMIDDGESERKNARVTIEF